MFIIKCSNRVIGNISKYFVPNFGVSLSLIWILDLFDLVTRCLCFLFWARLYLHFQSYDAYSTLLCLFIGESQPQKSDSAGSSALREQLSSKTLQNTGPRQNAQIRSKYLDSTPTFSHTERNLCVCVCVRF